MATTGVMPAMCLSVFSQTIVATRHAPHHRRSGRLRPLHLAGDGLIAASSFTAAADLFPPQGRGRFAAYAGLASGIAAVVGPLLGGFITDHFAWNWIFLLNVPVGLVVLAIVLSLIVAMFLRPPRPTAAGTHGPDDEGHGAA